MSSTKLGLQDIHIFNISWTGMHQNCQIIAGEIFGHGAKVTIVYSDKDDNFKHPINIDSIRTHDSLYWVGKFKVCIDNLTRKCANNSR
jgi:hypothetical protein